MCRYNLQQLVHLRNEIEDSLWKLDSTNLTSQASEDRKPGLPVIGGE
jgi:hypothetical protein